MTRGARPEAAGGTVQGKHRATNQDNHAILGRGRVVILADGVAGPGDGAAASRAAVDAVCDYFFGIDPELRDPRSAGSSISMLQAAVVELHLRSAFTLAHAAVLRAAAATGQPIASSLLVTVMLERQVVIAHVGDCRAYRSRHNFLTQLTQDHIVCPPEFADLSPDDVAALRPLVCIVDRLVGKTPAPACDLDTDNLEPSDTLLLCSNGLSHALPRWVMAEVLLESSDAMDACRRLLQVASDVHAEDDATVVVVRPAATN